MKIEAAKEKAVMLPKKLALYLVFSLGPVSANGADLRR